MVCLHQEGGEEERRGGGGGGYAGELARKCLGGYS